MLALKGLLQRFTRYVGKPRLRPHSPKHKAKATSTAGAWRNEEESLLIYNHHFHKG